MGPNDSVTPNSQPDATQPRAARLRLWPGVLIVALELLLIRAPIVEPGTMPAFILMFWTPIIATLAILLWWLLASGLRWRDRWQALLAYVVAGSAVAISGRSALPVIGLTIYALPTVSILWVLWLLVSMPLGWRIRQVGLVLTIVCAWGFFSLLRMEGAEGNLAVNFAWRWQPTAEERFLADARARGVKAPDVKDAGPTDAGAPASEVLQAGPGDWTGFRGPLRNAVRGGEHIDTDWQRHPPKLVWRHRVGPGWSSFAVVGDRLYTQEQRGDDEVVVCYRASTGEEIWTHADATRFSETVAGPGPRGTPTFDQGHIFALGANGRLNCLDALTGKAVWSRDAAADTEAKVPQWGFSSSPLALENAVIVFVGGAEGKSLAAYQPDTGDLLWTGGEGQFSYSSPQRAEIGGTEQVLIVTEAGLLSLDPATGKQLWAEAWTLPDGMARVVQPAIVGEADFLVGTGFGHGTRRVHVDHGAKGWTAEELWTTKAIRPYYNDLVVFQDHLYGFDNNFFTCVSLADGSSRWRVRGYGNGQVLLLPDQGLLLIISEKGEVALVEATPTAHHELAKFQAIEGKTWNHPVLVNGKLFVRNGEEAACYELTPREPAQAAVSPAQAGAEPEPDKG